MLINSKAVQFVSLDDQSMSKVGRRFGKPWSPVEEDLDT
jgi:hypothetical protein